MNQMIGKLASLIGNNYKLIRAYFNIILGLTYVFNIVDANVFNSYLCYNLSIYSKNHFSDQIFKYWVCFSWLIIFDNIMRSSVVEPFLFLYKFLVIIAIIYNKRNMPIDNYFDFLKMLLQSVENMKKTILECIKVEASIYQDIVNTEPISTRE